MEAKENIMAADNMREFIQQTYGSAAKAAVENAGKTSCCGAKTPAPKKDPITRNLYPDNDAAQVPTEALAASFGCGNPTALANLAPGEVVLDLGSGGGIDVLLSAKRVGPTGKAYGLDMTAEMLEIARTNQRNAGVTNAEFLEGTIEAIPLPEASVDVIVSNCVINLSTDKDQVLREAFRVLRSGGRFAVSDMVLRRPLPDILQKSVELWAGCVAGALLESEYRKKLAAAGFVDIEFEPTRVFGIDDAKEVAGLNASCCSNDFAAALEAADGALMSAFIRARKPA